MSESVEALVPKLVKIQQELRAPKNQFNSFGKYNYRSCEDILEAVKPLCHAAGVVLTISDEVVQVGERVYVKATAVLLAESGEQLQAVAYAREAAERKGMDASQITGTASSYARKYALNGLFCIDDAKDADAQGNPPAHPQRQQQPQSHPRAPQQPPQQSPPPEPPPYKQQSSANDGLRKAFHATGTELYGKGWDAKRKELCVHYHVESSNDLTAEAIHHIIDGMKKKLATAAGNGG